VPIEKSNQRLYIRIENSSDQQTLVSLKQTLDKHKGETQVVLVLGQDSAKQAIKLPGGIDRDSEGFGLLQELVGSDNLVLK